MTFGTKDEGLRHENEQRKTFRMVNERRITLSDELHYAINANWFTRECIDEYVCWMHVFEM